MAQATTRTRRQMSPYHTPKALAAAKPCLRPAQVLVRDSRRPAGTDAGLFHPERLRRQPRCNTCAPAPAPGSAAWHCPLGDPTTRRWAASSRVVPACAPPDGDNGALGWGRLCPTSRGVDHWPCSRPLRLSMTGTARGGGEGGATPGGGGGGRGGSRAGGGRCCNAAPPCVLVVVRQFLRRGHRSFIGNNR
jgi:hypothetical protein